MNVSLRVTLESTQTLGKPTALKSQSAIAIPIKLPDHKQLPDSDGTFVKNYQEHPQSIVLTSSIAPVLEKLHPDGRYCIGQDSGIYWRMMEATEKAGKFWVYEQAIRIPFYVNFNGWQDHVEVYQLLNGRYAKMQPNARGHYPISPMAVEIGLQQAGTTTWLRWWDESGDLLLTGDERAVQAEAIADQERLIANQERQQKEKLATYLRSMGINPDEI